MIDACIEIGRPDATATVTVADLPLQAQPRLEDAFARGTTAPALAKLLLKAERLPGRFAFRPPLTELGTPRKRFTILLRRSALPLAPALDRVEH